MRRLALVLLGIAVASGPASAQVFSEFTLNNLTNLRLSRASCDGDVFVRRLVFSGVNGGVYQLRFMEVDRVVDCPSDLLDLTNGAVVFLDDGEGNALEGEAFSPQEGALITDNLTPLELLRDVTCSGEGRRVEVYLCAQLFALPSSTVALDVAQIVIDIDTTIPPVPELSRVVGGNGKVTVTFEDIPNDDGDAYRFRVESRLCPLASDDVTDADEDSSCGASASADVEEVVDGNDIEVSATNGRVIEFRASALDDFDNEGAQTAWQQAE